jgi:hypothetical protein
MLGMQLSRFRSMMRRMCMVPVRSVSVVRRALVITSIMMLCGLTMVPSRVLVMFGCAVMVFCRLLGHGSSLNFVLGDRG